MTTFVQSFAWIKVGNWNKKEAKDLQLQISNDAVQMFHEVLLKLYVPVVQGEGQRDVLSWG